MMQEFVQQVTDTAKGIMEGMHTAIPGVVVSFDVSTCMATIQPKMKFRKPDGSTIDYPNISGVPVVIPQSAGQNATVAFPIKAGDSGLIIAAEQSLDYWMYEQETSTNLHFDLTNGVFIPGLFNKPNKVLAEATNSNAVIIDVNGTRATVMSGLVKIDAAAIQLNGNVTIQGNLTTSGGRVSLN